MYTFAGTCPHCGSDRGFQAFGSSPKLIIEKDYSTVPVSHRGIEMKHDEKNPYVKFSLAGVCLTCQQPVVAASSARDKVLEEINACIQDFGRQSLVQVKVDAIYPKRDPKYAHPSIPEKINKSFVDVQKMFDSGLQPHFVIGGCRSVLENALNALGANGSTLYKKIENLHDQGLITETIKDWAHIIRNNGNDAVHELNGKREDAEDLLNFTKIFLQYAFELPAVIKAMRNKRK